MAERENIRSRLKKHQLTQVWLINQLGLRGIVTDKTEMSSVLAGTRSGSKADAIIELSHDILDKYEEGSVLVKRDWWQMIQLLPSSYNQKRTVQLNYAVLKNIYHARRNHKLDEWHTFCHFIESLPHSELITE